MPMAHVSKIGAENPYQKKTGTINRHKNRACPIRYMVGYQNISVPDCISDASETVTGFLIAVSAPICGKCVMCIKVERTKSSN